MTFALSSGPLLSGALGLSPSLLSYCPPLGPLFPGASPFQRISAPIASAPPAALVPMDVEALSLPPRMLRPPGAFPLVEVPSSVTLGGDPGRIIERELRHVRSHLDQARARKAELLGFRPGRGIDHDLPSHISPPSHEKTLCLRILLSRSFGRFLCYPFLALSLVLPMLSRRPVLAQLSL